MARYLAPLVILSSLVQSAPIDPSTILDQLKKNVDCCTALNYLLPGKVVTPLDPKYTSSQLSFWSAQEQSLHPTCIVIPTSTQDVSTAVTVLSTGYRASIPGCKFAVRGAGHTPQAGAANIDNGVTIDTQSLNQVTVSSDRKIVSIGPGNRWGAVYSVLDNLDLAMVGGRLVQVGVAGLLTGGGVSFFSGRYGFACNNIQSYEVVLGNGSIVTASSSLNPNLYRALKGGSNNFGIVTRFDSRLFPQSTFWGGQITQPVTAKQDYFDFMVNFTRSATYDPYAALISIFGWLNGLPIPIIQAVTYTRNDTAWPPPTFAQLDAIPKITSTMRIAKLSSFATELATDSAVAQGQNNFFLTTTFVNTGEVTAAYMSAVWDLVNQAAVDLITVVGLAITMAFQPLPHVLYSRDASTNVLGLDRFQDDLINLLFTLIWTLPTDNERVYARMRVLEQDVIALAKDMGVYNEWIYLNYASQWQKPVQSYGAQSVAFMKGVSTQYDPQGVFQNAVPGGFKLPN